MAEDGFIAAILDDPTPEIHRLVYADWLEDQGDPRAEFLRVECALLNLVPGDVRLPTLQKRLQELLPALDPDWLALIRRMPANPLDELRAIVPPPRRPLHAN